MGESTGDAERVDETALHFHAVVKLEPEGESFEQDYGPFPRSVKGYLDQQFAAGYVVGGAAALGVKPNEIGLIMYEGDEVIERTGICK